MNDLYDRIRPPTEVLDEDTAARVWGEIRREAPVEAARPERDTPSTATSVALGPVADAPRRTHIIAWVAAAAVVAGIAGIGAAAATRSETIAPANTAAAPEPDPRPESDPTPHVGTSPSPLPEPEASPPGPLSVGSEASPNDLWSGTKFAVVDVLPDGMTVSTVRAESAGAVFGDTQWVQLGADGSVTGVINVRAPRLLTAEEAARSASDFEDAVRGLPATEWRAIRDDGAGSPQSGILWIENSLAIQVTATGTADELVRPIAEALVLDVESRTVTVPDEFELVAAADLDFVDSAAVRTTLFMQPAWSDSQGVNVSTRPNTFGYDLDQLVGTDQDWQTVEIDAIPARGLRTSNDDLVALAWLDDGMFVSITTSLALSDAEMFDVMRGVRFVDVDEFQMFGRTVADRENAEMGTWALFDRTVTEDGIELSVRSKPGSIGANALCVDAPILDCTLILSEGGIIDGQESYGAAGFDLGDRKVGVGWVSADIDDATSGPSLHPSFSLDPSEVPSDETSAIVLFDIATDLGRFVVVDQPEGEHPPTIRFDSNGAGGPSIELIPTLDGPFDF